MSDVAANECLSIGVTFWTLSVIGTEPGVKTTDI